MAVQTTSIILSSLPLQISLFHHYYYDLAFFLLGCALLIYKAVNEAASYPPAARAWESIILVFWFIIDLTRIRACSNGNKTEESTPIILALIFTIPILFAHLYFVLWQKFIMDVELITNIIALLFVFFETLLGVQLVFRLKTTNRFL